MLFSCANNTWGRRLQLEALRNAALRYFVLRSFTLLQNANLAQGKLHKKAQLIPHEISKHETVS